MFACSLAGLFVCLLVCLVVCLFVFLFSVCGILVLRDVEGLLHLSANPGDMFHAHMLSVSSFIGSLEAAPKPVSCSSSLCVCSSFHGLPVVRSPTPFAKEPAEIESTRK